MTTASSVGNDIFNKANVTRAVIRFVGVFVGTWLFEVNVLQAKTWKELVGAAALALPVAIEKLVGPS